MLIKLLVGVFERAKSKFKAVHGLDRVESESESDFDDNIYPSSVPGTIVVEQPSRLSLTKWLCTTPAIVNRSSPSLKSGKVRRSSSWRSLKERGNNCFENFASRTLSVDELHRKGKKALKHELIKKQQQKQNLPKADSTFVPYSTIELNYSQSKSSSSTLHPVRIVNCDDFSSLSTFHQRHDRLSSTLIRYSTPSKRTKKSCPTGSYSDQHSNLIYSLRQNASSGGADSGYSEESFALTRRISQTRPSLHTSCSHGHCEQRSSFYNYGKSNKHHSTESSTSDNTINKDILRSEFSTHCNQDQQTLSTSRSYPHIKPLPRVNDSLNSVSSSTRQQTTRRTRTSSMRRRTRRRHLSCDSSVWSKIQVPKITDPELPMSTGGSTNVAVQHDFRKMQNIDPHSAIQNWKSFLPLQTKNQVFGELNLAAIELDSIRTADHYNLSVSSSYSSSVTSSTSSLNTSDQQFIANHQQFKKKSQRRQTFLVWHEYKNTSLLSTAHGTKIFSVIRGDQVRLLRRIGKSTLLVQKEDDGSIGFLPQSCLADDQIQSFLSVKGLRETIL